MSCADQTNHLPVWWWWWIADGLAFGRGDSRVVYTRGCSDYRKNRPQDGGGVLLRRPNVIRLIIGGASVVYFDMWRAR